MECLSALRVQTTESIILFLIRNRPPVKVSIQKGEKVKW